MKRLVRNPEKFDPVGLFDAIGREHDYKLGDSESEKDFMARLSHSLSESKANPQLLHGQRVESMFGYVAAALGSCALVKQEDIGSAFIDSDDVVIPDYKVVLKSGRQFLVEVKNSHASSPSEVLRLKKRYVRNIQKYANTVGLDLMVAVYWSQWNLWHLIPFDKIPSYGNERAVSMIDAAKINEMSELGDVLVSTLPPLTLRFVTDASQSRSIEETGKVEFTIGDIELLCAGQRLVDRTELDLAFYFFRYSSWRLEDPIPNIEGDQLMSIDLSARPIEDQPEQPFQGLGWLSSMFSRQYAHLTAPDGKVEKLSPALEPHDFGIRLPEGYKGQQLPLWIYSIKPMARIA